MDGLVHVSEIAHQHVGKPSDALTVGEDVQVKILSINPEEGRISLSIKETLPGPWTDIETKAAAGTVLDGTVKVLHEGDQVQVKVLEVNPEEHRIALSIKALEPKPESQEEPKEEQEYELPEENTGFTMGDILGDALSDAKEEE